MENLFGVSQNLQFNPWKNLYNDGGVSNDDIDDNSAYHLLTTYYVPVPFLSMLYELSH